MTQDRAAHQMSSRVWGWRWFVVASICIMAISTMLVAEPVRSLYRQSRFPSVVESMGGEYWERRLAWNEYDSKWHAAIYRLTMGWVNLPEPIRETQVQLTGPQFDDAWLEQHRKQLAKLEYLDLSFSPHCSVTEQGIVELGDLPRLTELRICEAQAGDQFFEWLSHQTGVRRIIMPAVAVSESSLAAFNRMSGLKVIEVLGLNDEAILNLRSLTSPAQLWISDHQLTEASEPLLKDLSVSREVYLEISENLSAPVRVLQARGYRLHRYQELCGDFKGFGPETGNVPE